MTGDVLQTLSAFVYRQKKRKIVNLVKAFNRQQWLDQRELLTRCDQLSLKLLRHACQHVPYYKKIIDALELSVDNLRFPEDWQRLPLLRKTELTDYFDELKSDTATVQNSYLNHTGGSTGIPVNFLTDIVQAQRMTAWLDLVFSWAGWQPGEICLELWGNREQQIPLTLRDKLRAILSGHCILPVYEYSESTMRQWLLVIKQLHPTILYGYPSVLADFARWLESEPHQVTGIKGVFSSAEVLYPEQRAIIEKYFNCKVFNQYGSRETPCIACECPEGGMHLFVDFNRLEFIDSKDHPESKEIIVTPLYNYVQPLIRYRLGDMGTPASSCSCGRGYPLMEINVARSRDVITGPNGVSFYPGFFTRLMDGKKSVRSFQFVQRQADVMELNVEVSGVDDVAGYCEQLETEIIPYLKEKMGSVQFIVNPVNKIDRTSAGKHRFVISKINNGA